MTTRKKHITIINTGCANLASVKFAFERLGVEALVTDDVNAISRADRVIFSSAGRSMLFFWTWRGDRFFKAVN